MEGGAMFIFPFGDVKQNSKIVIWGGGRVGKTYVSQVKKTGYAIINSVIDRNEVFIDGIKILKPARIKDISADYIVIAVNNDLEANEIRNIILEAGVDVQIVYNIISTDMCIDNLHLREIPSYSVYDCDKSEKLDGESLNNLIRIVKSLKIKKTDYELVRIGGNKDGGYLMVNKFRDGGVAYSIGIGENIMWDVCMADKGFNVYMYDHTVSALDLPEVNEKLHFFSVGLSDREIEDEKFTTLIKAIKSNGHEKFTNIILKMDIEGAEWNVFKSIDGCILQLFEQVIVEYHGLTQKNHWGKYVEVLEKMTKTHQVVHVHGNNACDYMVIDGKRIPDTIEVTYFRKEGNHFAMCNPCLPQKNDSRNVAYLDEIQLGYWNNLF